MNIRNVNLQFSPDFVARATSTANMTPVTGASREAHDNGL